MRMSLDMSLTRPYGAGTIDPSAGYALYLPFSAASPTYRVGATTSSPTPAALPGYGPTRTGAKGEVNALTGADRIDDFAANVPAIIPGVGYWSRGALTNYALQSQTFGTTWAPFGSATFDGSNLAVAPDGTTTADAITFTGAGGVLFQNITGPTGFATPSMWVRAVSGTVGCRMKTLTNGIDRFGPDVVATTTWQQIAYPYDGAAFAHTQIGVAANSGGTLLGQLYIWQGQTLNGNHPQGGPVIVTDAATASIGADLFPLTVAKPAAAFVIYGKAVLSAAKTANSFLFYWGAADGTNVIRAYVEATSNLLVFNVVNASVSTAITGESGTPATSRTVTFALRFNGSTWRAFVNGVAQGAESAAAAIPIDGSMKVASANASNQLDDRLTDLHVIEGNKTDGEVTALMTAL